MKKELEVWVDVPEYEGHYQVSNLGRVRSLDRIITDKNGKIKNKRGEVLKPFNNGRNYLQVILNKSGTRKSVYVHRLVMKVFVGDSPQNYVVCHNDGNPYNNQISNLRYDTLLENTIDQFRHGTCGLKGLQTLDTILKIREDFDSKKLSRPELMKKYNMSKSSIREITNRITYDWLDDEGKIRKSETAIYYKNSI